MRVILELEELEEEEGEEQNYCFWLKKKKR